MPALDDFSFLGKTADGPASHAAIVTPSDSTDLASATRAIYIGAAGAVKLTTLGGETLVLASGVLAVGVPHPIRATRIWSTGTTATPIVAVW